MDLKKNICDNIKECEIKIGYREEDMNLYYPQASLLELLPAEKLVIANGWIEGLAGPQNRSLEN